MKLEKIEVEFKKIRENKVMKKIINSEKLSDEIIIILSHNIQFTQKLQNEIAGILENDGKSEILERETLNAFKKIVKIVGDDHDLQI